MGLHRAEPCFRLLYNCSPKKVALLNYGGGDGKKWKAGNTKRPLLTLLYCQRWRPAWGAEARSLAGKNVMPHTGAPGFIYLPTETLHHRATSSFHTWFMKYHSWAIKGQSVTSYINKLQGGGDHCGISVFNICRLLMLGLVVRSKKLKQLLGWNSVCHTGLELYELSRVEKVLWTPKAGLPPPSPLPYYKTRKS